MINELRNKREKAEEHEIDVNESVWGTSENSFWLCSMHTHTHVHLKEALQSNKQKSIYKLTR